MKTTNFEAQYPRKTLLRRRAIKPRAIKKAEEQTEARENGRGLSFFAKETAKTLLNPATDDHKKG
jgi:hypothetical protein